MRYPAVLSTSFCNPIPLQNQPARTLSDSFILDRIQSTVVLLPTFDSGAGIKGKGSHAPKKQSNSYLLLNTNGMRRGLEGICKDRFEDVDVTYVVVKLCLKAIIRS